MTDLDTNKMERTEALDQIRSPNPRVRLEGARTLMNLAESRDLPQLKDALAVEDVSWIRGAIERTVSRLEGSSPAVPPEDVGLSVAGEAEEIYAQAVEETTGRLVHELGQIVEALDMSAASEVPGFDDSDTRYHLVRLEEMLGAIRDLGRAAMAPRLKTFDLPALVKETVHTFALESWEQIEFHGQDPLHVHADKRLVDIALTNGLRNAVEASRATHTAAPWMIIVSWGETDTEYWVDVLDSGSGMPPAHTRAFEIGSTTKRGHLGMGLALARRAMQSVGGDVEASPASTGGVLFELRWPMQAS